MFYLLPRKLHFRATPGGAGKGSGMHGAMGGDCIVLVPPGTIIRRKDADEDAPPLAELVLPGEVYVG
jgi:GTP-binding protein